MGWAGAEFSWASAADDVGEVWVAVRSENRGRGVGSRLYETGLEHLIRNGAREIRTSAGEEAGRRFAERRGFRETRAEELSAVDPRSVDVSALPALEAELAAKGYPVVPLAELRERSHDVFALYAEVDGDVPADHPETRIEYEEWVRETLEDPALGYEGSFVVLAGERPVSLAFLHVDPEGRRAEHDLTGTARDFRRRGLARLAKLATIRWAAENGVERLLTSNDSTNAGMLALNRALGYRPVATWREHVRSGNG